MKWFYLYLAVVSLVCIHAAPGEESDDVLSFTNGDSLQGAFVGMDGDDVIWQRKGADPVRFSMADLRLISFNKGFAEKPLKPGHLIYLVTGDVIPGEVIGLSKEELKVRTEFAGEFNLPRKWVKSFESVSSGGDLVFYGPSSDQDWDIVSSKVGPEDDRKPVWKFDSSAFYVQGVGFACPAELSLPDDFELNFRLSTRDVSVVSIAFFSDKEEIGDEAIRSEIIENRNNYYGDSRNSKLYGSSLVLDLSGNRAQLSEVIAPEPEAGEAEKDEAAKPQNGRNRRIGSTTNFIRNSGGFDVDIQLRASRSIGLVQLLVDGKHSGSWKMNPQDMPSGSFLKFGLRRGRIRLSDICVSEWNRMPDSALSMQSRKRDVILMKSGTDRFSGKVLGYVEEMLKVETSFGVLSLNCGDVSEVVFASDAQDSAADVEDYKVMLKMSRGARIGGEIQIKGDKPVFVSRFGAEWAFNADWLNFIEFDDYDPNLEKWYE